MSKNIVDVPVTALRVGDRLYDRTWVCDGTVKASISDGEKPIGFHVLWHKFDPKIETRPDVPDNIFFAHNKTVYQLYYKGYDPTDLMKRFGATKVTCAGQVEPRPIRQWIGIFPGHLDLSKLLEIMGLWYDADDMSLDVLGENQQLIVWE